MSPGRLPSIWISALASQSLKIRRALSSLRGRVYGDVVRASLSTAGTSISVGSGAMYSTTNSLLTSRKLGRHFGVEGRGFQQRRRQYVADAGYRDVLVPVLETSALGHHRPVAFESDLCVITIVPIARWGTRVAQGLSESGAGHPGRQWSVSSGEV